MVRCTWCNRKLKHPIWKNGKAYGRVCITKVQVVSPDYQEELKALQMQVRELKMELQQIKMNGHIAPMTPPVGGLLPKVLGNSNGGNGHSNKPPIGMNYGCDHGALMDELKSVLKERVASA